MFTLVKRNYEDKIMEQEQKLAAMMQKLQQQREVLKQLKVKEENEARKYRNHMLIVCGAEIASLYGFSFLGEDEIHKVVNFLRDSMASGVFVLEKQEEVKSEKTETVEEKAQEEELDDGFFGMTIF